MKTNILVLKRYLLILAIAGFGLFQWSCSSSSGPSSPGGGGGGGNLNLILGTIDGTIADSGSGPVTSFSIAEALIYTNQPVTDASVMVSYNSGGPVTLTIPYFGSAALGSTVISTYEVSSPGITYAAGTNYTMSVSYSAGNFSSTMSAPGGIVWSGLITTTLTATASTAGNYDSANALRIYPTPGVTYTSSASSVGSPFNYPSSAFSSSSTPATFTATYSAATTQYSFSGSPSSGSAFVWLESYSKYFNK